MGAPGIDYRKIIYVDVDDTITDLLPSWVNYLNNRYRLSVSVKDCHYWDMTLLYPMLSRSQIVEALWDSELWKTVKPIQDSPYYLNRLMEDGFDVYLTTSTHVTHLKDKYEYVINKYFPFIPENHIITIHRKQFLKGLVLVDDYIENLRDAEYRGILYTSQHNLDLNVDRYNGVQRAKNWADVYNQIHIIYLYYGLTF